MPYLQLDIPLATQPDEKRRLARAFGEIYARIMRIDPALITVAIRELGEGGVWRCGSGEPEPAAIIMCDIRRGRSVETRGDLARELVAACAPFAGLRPEQINVEFTQHDGDEMFHPRLGGFNRDWSAEEAS